MNTTTDIFNRILARFPGSISYYALLRLDMIPDVTAQFLVIKRYGLFMKG